MYSYEQRLRAVDLYIQLGKRLDGDHAFAGAQAAEQVLALGLPACRAAGSEALARRGREPVKTLERAAPDCHGRHCPVGVRRPIGTRVKVLSLQPPCLGRLWLNPPRR